MEFFTVRIQTDIAWLIEERGPLEVILTHYPGWSVLTPAALEHRDADRRTSPVQVNQNQYMFFSNYIVFAYRGEPVSCSGSHVVALAQKVIARLRYVSGQFLISSNIELFIDTPSKDALTRSEMAPFLKLNAKGQYMLSDFEFRSALTYSFVQKAAALPDDFDVPVHNQILSDALSAHVESDYRRSILYSCMAIESLALEKLDSAYDSVMQERSTDHRVVCFPAAGGKDAWKDPIYELLRARDDFKHLLHEQPLYLIKRSLLREDKDLYDDAIRLYRTRNKLVHRGSPPLEKEYLPLTVGGSKSALLIAIKVVRWLGDDSLYFVPGGLIDPFDGSSVSIESMRGERRGQNTHNKRIASDARGARRSRKR